ncbi:MAG: hypothetical protein JJE39_05995 [Vicinamibacteria bacterium]|nr:hypothetical protein [Vicinamibacteria bacterium]
MKLVPAPAGAAPPDPVVPQPPPRQAPKAGGAGLKIGEYACYGSGGRILAGLGFKVLPGNIRDTAAIAPE